MMKKIIIFVTLLLCSLGVWAQQTTVKTNFTIQKANPTLYLNGTAAVLDFYNGDVTFTQSSNLLTLAGGNLSLGSNSLLMTGSIGATLARVTKGWFIDLEITNLPTINGGTLATALSLSSYLLKTDTAAMLTNYINKADTSTMLLPYMLTSEGYDNTLMEARIDSIVAVLGDTINIETLLDIELSTDTVADLSELRALETILYDTISFETEELSDVVQLNAATRSVMTFGGGGGNAGDTTLFTTSSLYGSAYWGGSLSFHVDSMIVSMVHGLGLDTLGVQISWSDTLKAVVPTNLNTAALPIGRVAGVNKALTVGQVDAAFDNAIIPPGKMVWCTTPYVPAAALKRKPTYLSVTLIGHLQ
jgi:hypothetical protein